MGEWLSIGAGHGMNRSITASLENVLMGLIIPRSEVRSLPAPPVTAASSGYLLEPPTRRFWRGNNVATPRSRPRSARWHRRSAEGARRVLHGQFPSFPPPRRGLITSIEFHEGVQSDGTESVFGVGQRTRVNLASRTSSATTARRKRDLVLGMCGTGSWSARL